MEDCPTCHAPQKHGGREWWCCSFCGERLRRRMNPLLGVYLGLLGTVLYAFSDIFVRRVPVRLDTILLVTLVVILFSIVIARSDFMLRFMPIGRARSHPSMRFLAEVGLASAVSFAVGLLLTLAIRV